MSKRSRYISSALVKRRALKKPTVLVLIDRNELEDQMLRNLTALGLNNVRHANSISELNRLLEIDYRGIIVSTIHKFHDCGRVSTPGRTFSC